MKLSNVKDLILEICEPRDRWTPEHLIHNIHNKLIDTHSTVAVLPQSQHFKLDLSILRTIDSSSSLLEAPALAKEKCCVCCLEESVFVGIRLLLLLLLLLLWMGWVWWLMWWECVDLCRLPLRRVDKYVNDSWGERNGNPDGKEGGICSNINDSLAAINKAMLFKITQYTSKPRSSSQRFVWNLHRRDLRRILVNFNALLHHDGYCAFDAVLATVPLLNKGTTFLLISVV